VQKKNLYKKLHDKLNQCQIYKAFSEIKYHQGMWQNFQNLHEVLYTFTTNNPKALYDIFSK